MAGIEGVRWWTASLTTVESSISTSTNPLATHFHIFLASRVTAFLSTVGRKPSATHTQVWLPQCGWCCWMWLLAFANKHGVSSGCNT